MRANNASVYQLHWGFDAPWNWEYVEHLTRTWELPAPHAGWSYAQPPLFFYGSAALARAPPTGPNPRPSPLYLTL